MAALPTSNASGAGNLQLWWDHATAPAAGIGSPRRRGALLPAAQPEWPWVAVVPATPPGLPAVTAGYPPPPILPTLPGCRTWPPPRGTSARAFLFPPALRAGGAASTFPRVQEGQRLFPMVPIRLRLPQIASTRETLHYPPRPAPRLAHSLAGMSPSRWDVFTHLPLPQHTDPRGLLSDLPSWTPPARASAVVAVGELPPNIPSPRISAPQQPPKFQLCPLAGLGSRRRGCSSRSVDCGSSAAHPQGCPVRRAGVEGRMAMAGKRGMGPIA